MRPHNFWRWSLALPLVCPAVAFCILFVSASLGEPPLLVTQTLMTVSMSGYILGVPYALFAGALLAVLWSRSLAAYKRAALVAPIMFDLVLIAIAAILTLTSHSELAEVFAPKFRSFYVLELVLGYVYVGVVFAGAWVLARLHIFGGSGVASERSA